MKRNLFAFLAFFALTLGVIQAQSILTIQGQITDDSTGAAVANRPVMVKADTLFLPGGGGPGTGGGQPIGFLGMDVTDSNGYYQIDIDLALFTGTQGYVVTHGCLLTHYVVPVQAIAGVTTVNFNVCVMVPGGGNPGGGHPGGGNPGGGNPGGGNPGGGHPGGGHPGGGNPGGGNPGGGLPGMGCHAYFGGHPDTANLLTWNFNTMPKSPTATYDWSFGDGNTASGLNVTNTYAAFGQYNVCLVLTDTAFQCADTFCKLINVDST
ncbi:MAG: PKD domain-containing protein, partial [Bacteroidales bacterium]|nr:PKD domain-containing protein [Bacteroidales bacterium]